jgi:polyketide cyclase/dehydrase/lipid transport protein
MIAAGKAQVMSVIADLNSYPTWMSSFTGVEILSAGPGGRAERVRFNLAAGPIRDTYVLAYEWDGEDSVRWTMVEPGKKISDLSGAYLLVQQDGGTEVTHEFSVEASILKLPPVRRQIEKMIIEMALKDLKRRVEQGADAGPE